MGTVNSVLGFGPRKKPHYWRWLLFRDVENSDKKPTLVQKLQEFQIQRAPENVFDNLQFEAAYDPIFQVITAKPEGTQNFRRYNLKLINLKHQMLQLQYFGK